MSRQSETTHPLISVILPCKNEEANLERVLPKLFEVLPEAEILVINDGSTDGSKQVAERCGARCVSHPYNLGNGAAVKTGARHAKGSTLVFMDADGQHDPNDIPRLLEKLDQGYDMVVGARVTKSQASRARLIANYSYNRLASLMTGFRILDLTSGFRAVRARHFRKFIYLLPNTFSYPTTITMAFFRSGLPVAYIPIKTAARGGKSHIHILKDGLRFLVIILKIGALFSPMRFFLPLATLLFLVGGLVLGLINRVTGHYVNIPPSTFKTCPVM